MSKKKMESTRELMGTKEVTDYSVKTYRNEELEVHLQVPALTYTDAEATERATLYADISNYLLTAKAQFITGELDIDSDWDAHLEKLNQMGLERILEIDQAAYDRWNAAMSVLE